MASLSFLPAISGQSQVVSERLPRWLVLGVIGCSVAPLLLNLAGLDFGSVHPAARGDLSSADAAIRTLSGTYVHTILEWSATVTAVFTALLAFTHFRIKRDVVTPIIGLALLSAGTVDAFHTLAADRLISATADNRQFVPFTWAISRSFNAMIPLTALALLFFTHRFNEGSHPRKRFWIVVIAALALGGLAYGLIVFCATTSTLPRTMFPEQMVTRPWDVYPLAIYAVSGLVIYPAFRRGAKSYFTMSLWLSVIPDVATQLHMALGSVSLFDNHFNVAHALKILAYLVPCVGLVLDYVETYSESERHQQTAATRADELRVFKEVLERIPVGLTILQRDAQTPGALRILHVNSAFEQMFACRNVVGEPLETCLPAQLHEKLKENAAKALESSEPELAPFLEYTSGNGAPRAVVDVKTVPLGTQRVGVVLESITARIDADAKLRSTVDELQRSNADLERFAYIASHDLQEPLRMVTSYTELLGRRYSGKLDEKADRYINHAVDGAKRMQALLSDLLKYARVNAGTRDRTPVAIDEVLDQVTASLQVAIADAGASIDRESMPIVLGDATQIGQVFQNLISNALKFTKCQSPRIRITADDDGERWKLGVHDDGIGLAPEHQDRIFDVFSRLHGRADYPGNGVGLAITKRIIEQHGGTVWVDSTPGDGASFFFTLPADRRRKSYAGGGRWVA